MNDLATTAFSRAAASASARPPSSGLTHGNWVRDDRHLMLIGGMIWILVVLMIVPEGLDYTDLSSAGAPTSGGIVSRLLWLGLLLGGISVIFWRPALAWLVTRTLNPFLLGFVLLAALSAAWSIDPPVTIRRLIRILTIVIDSTAFVLVGWHVSRFQNVLRDIITLVLLVSVLFGLVWPKLAIHQDTSGVLVNAWHGLANHKNGFGDIAGVGLILWFHAWLSKAKRAFPALLGCGLAFACLVLSRSSTSLVAAVFTLLLLTILLRSPNSMRRSMPILVSLFIAALLVYSMALLRLVPGLDLVMAPIEAITGKDMSFTGRTDIWDIISAHIRLHPMLGTGYGAYWTGPVAGNPSYEFIERLYFYPGSAHNGYLEILNDLGALGLVVLFLYLGNFVSQSLRLLRADRIQASLYLALFLQQAITNMSESRWLDALSVDFVFMTLATAALARSLLEQRLRGFLGDPTIVPRPQDMAATAP